jgi:hypothetical protein
MYLEKAHARNYGTDEVNVENRVEIHKVESHGNGHKSEAIDGCHGVSKPALNELKKSGELLSSGNGFKTETTLAPRWRTDKLRSV